MASNIDTVGLDENYPIAGVDNDSQGFRDNFTNTKANLDHAKTELEDLQNNVILKGDLQNFPTSADDHNDMQNTKITNALLINDRKLVTTPTLVGVNQEIDVESAGYFEIGASSLLTFINWPADSGSYGEVIIDIDNTLGSSAYDVTFATPPFGLSRLATYSSAGILTIPVGGRVIYKVFSIDNGATLVISPISDGI